jgi:hypothetical protein
MEWYNPVVPVFGMPTIIIQSAPALPFEGFGDLFLKNLSIFDWYFLK